MTHSYPFIPYSREFLAEEVVRLRSQSFYSNMNQRRSVRDFSSRPVPRDVIENLLKAANCAPSGAHKQPWTFCAVANPQLKSAIRKAAEAEEYDNYHSRMSEEWLQDLKPFGTDWHKPFLETAPWLIVAFKRIYEAVDGIKHNNYYVSESVGIACGFLLTAVHEAGLVALTHTPSPMNFLTTILDRPENERPFLLIPVGYPAENTLVPDLSRKSLSEFTVWFE